VPEPTGQTAPSPAPPTPGPPVPRESPPAPELLAGFALALALGLTLWWNQRLKTESARRRAAQEELAAHQDLMEAVFNATSDAILVLDSGFRVLAVNPTGARRFGLDEAAMLGRDILSLTEDTVAATRRARYQEALAAGRPVAFRDARAGRTYDNLLTPLPVVPGGQARLAVFARDVTGQLASEAALRESRERLAQIFRLTPAVISITSWPDARYLEVNETFTTLTGYAREDVLGRSYRELDIGIDPDDQRRIAEGIERDGLVQNLEIPLRLKDGRAATGIFSCIPLEAYGQPCLLSVMMDITERKAMEQALLLAKDAAETASRAKSRFLSIMSHEIRTPMNMLLGMVDMLRETELNERQRGFLDTLEASGESLMALLSDILDLSRIESGSLVLACAAYAPETLLRQVAAAHAPTATAKGLALSVDVASGMGGTAWGDPAKIRQILDNLVGNALKFTPTGAVRLELARGPSRCGREELRFCVADTGIGIPPEKLQAIFEPFTQVDSSSTRAYGGTGLGLALCARLARGMGGRLSVESAPGQGSVFCCDLPRDARPGNAPL